MSESSPTISRRNLMITVGGAAYLGSPTGTVSAQTVSSDKISIDQPPEQVNGMNVWGAPDYLKLAKGSEIICETPSVRNGNKVDVLIEVNRKDVAGANFKRVGKGSYFETGSPVTLKPIDFDNTNLVSVYQSDTGEYVTNSGAWTFENETISDLDNKKNRILLCDFEMRIRLVADGRDVATESILFTLVFGLEGGLGIRLGYNIGGGPPVKGAFYVKPATVVANNGGNFTQNDNDRIKMNTNDPDYREVRFN